MPLYYTEYLSPLGRLRLFAQVDRLLALEFAAEQQALPPNCQPADPTSGSHWTIFGKTEAVLDRYFQGEAMDFAELDFLSPQGTPFQQAVWQILRRIPYGQTCSYAEIAAQLGKPNAARAVGGAVGRNPISILIPCHRVLGKDRALTGFGGGLPVKRALLQQEQITYQDQGVEFVTPKHQWFKRNLS